MNYKPLISEAGIPIVSDYGATRIITARDLRNMLNRHAYERIPYTSALPPNGPQRLAVYAKTPNGWRELSRDTINKAMLMRGPRQNQSMMSSVFADGLGLPKNAQYENLKKQLLTAQERRERIQSLVDDANHMQAFNEEEREIFEGDDEVKGDLTGLYKQPNQAAYAIVVRLPRGMTVPDLFMPITEPLKRPVAFEPSAEAVQAMVEEPAIKKEVFTFEPEKALYTDQPPEYETPWDEAPPYESPEVEEPESPEVEEPQPILQLFEETPPPPPPPPAPTPPPLPPLLLKDINSDDLVLASERLVRPQPPRVAFEEKPDFLTLLRARIDPDQVRNFEDESSSSFKD